jgi:hypothetical protein
MPNTWISLDRSAAAGALTIRVRKLRTIARQTDASSSKIQVPESLLTILFCRCAGRATGLGRMLSTRLAKRLFGMVATLFYGRSTSTQLAVTMRKPRSLSSGRRHFGFSGEY